jgi:hypothetical protein
MTRRRPASRPPGLVAPLLIALVAFLGLSISGTVIQLNGHAVGGVLLIAGVVIVAAFHRWSRRRWTDHRAGLE